MLRATQRLSSKRQYGALQLILKKSQYVWNQQHQKFEGVPTGALVAVGGLTAGFGGLPGYAAWSDENRKSAEDRIPGIQYVTDTILGQSTPSLPTPPPVKPFPAMTTKPPAPVSSASVSTKATSKKEEADKQPQVNLSEKKSEEKKKSKDTTEKTAKGLKKIPCIIKYKVMTQQKVTYNYWR